MRLSEQFKKEKGVDPFCILFDECGEVEAPSAQYCAWLERKLLNEIEKNKEKKNEKNN